MIRAPAAYRDMTRVPRKLKKRMKRSGYWSAWVYDLKVTSVTVNGTEIRAVLRGHRFRYAAGWKPLSVGYEPVAVGSCGGTKCGLACCVTCNPGTPDA